MRDQVLSVVSHDLRGPLNAIHSWGYVLERKIDAADPAAQRALTGIRSGVEQQVKLIETTVDTARAETKVLALSLQPWRDPHARRAQRGACARQPRERTRRRDEVESPLAEEQIEGDAERLTQALWLMLAFATEASARGCVGSFSRASWRAVRGARPCSFTASAAALMDKQVPHALEAVARKQATATARSRTHRVGAGAVQARRGGARRELRAGRYRRWRGGIRQHAKCRSRACEFFSIGYRPAVAHILTLSISGEGCFGSGCRAHRRNVARRVERVFCRGRVRARQIASDACQGHRADQRAARAASRQGPRTARRLSLGVPARHHARVARARLDRRTRFASLLHPLFALIGIESES